MAIATKLESRSFLESASQLEGQPGLSVFVRDEGSAMRAFLALLIAASTLLGGCVVVPYDGGYYGPYGSWGHRHHGHHGEND